jgi:hypothetical protein
MFLSLDQTALYLMIALTVSLLVNFLLGWKLQKSEKNKVLDNNNVVKLAHEMNRMPKMNHKRRNRIRILMEDIVEAVDKV